MKSLIYLVASLLGACGAVASWKLNLPMTAAVLAVICLWSLGMHFRES